MIKFVLVIFVCVNGCKSKAVSEGSCDGDELDRLQTTCLTAGGSFSADSSASDLRACELDADGSPIGGSGNANCALQGEGKCSINCELNVDDGASYSECWQNGRDECADDLADGGSFFGDSTGTNPTANGEIVGTECDVAYYCGFCQCWLTRHPDLFPNTPTVYCDSGYHGLCE
jgi:hypothetical protein